MNHRDLANAALANLGLSGGFGLGAAVGGNPLADAQRAMPMYFGYDGRGWKKEEYPEAPTRVGEFAKAVLILKAAFPEISEKIEAELEEKYQVAYKKWQVEFDNAVELNRRHRIQHKWNMRKQSREHKIDRQKWMLDDAIERRNKKWYNKILRIFR